MTINLDGNGAADVNTGIGMLDHMLSQLCTHGLFDLDVQATGDLEVDSHHTVEDVAICLGRALDAALGDKAGIARMGWAIVPMDEALALVSVDLSGRGAAVVDVPFTGYKLGTLQTEMICHFLDTFAVQGGVTLHARLAGRRKRPPQGRGCLQSPRPRAVPGRPDRPPPPKNRAQQQGIIGIADYSCPQLEGEMLRKFSVRNFRCLQELDIEPLARVNLIVGENNVGKTALLEALFLHFNPGRPEAPLGVNHSRGARGSDTETWEELEWLFHAKQGTELIELVGVSDREEECALRIRLADPKERLLHIPEANGDTQINDGMQRSVVYSSVLTLEYTDHTGQSSSARAYLTVGGISATSANLPESGRVALVLKNPRFSDEHAKRYSDLAMTGREDEMLPSLQAIDPRIQRLKLLFPGNKPMLYVDDGGDQLVPLTYMGEGLGYVLSWQLAILASENGTVLIDEFENGLHYSALTDVWKAVGLAARDSNVQVFATTHSWECVKAAQRAFAESGEDEFRLHRLEGRDGETIALTYDKEQLDTAMELNFEVR